MSETKNKAEKSPGGDDGLLYTLALECEKQLEETSIILAKQEGQAQSVKLWAEFEQRFTSWASYTGVFTRKSRSLDTRLRNYPDLQDLIARLLDILYRSISYFSREQTVVDGYLQISTLETIDDTLTRLNHMAVNIRQYSRPKLEDKVNNLLADIVLNKFLALCKTAVQSLYPNAHQRLKDLIGNSMAQRYAILYLGQEKQRQIETRRGPGPSHPSLSIIDEETKHNKPTAAKGQFDLRTQVIRNLALRKPVQQTQSHNAPSHSELSTIDIERLRSRIAGPDQPSVKSYRTRSIQVNHNKYPTQPPNTSTWTTHLFTCEWCSEIFDRRKLSESDWRRHIERDLKPYLCLSESCSSQHPSFSTLDEWITHMHSHDRRWYRKIFLKPSWICTICEDDNSDTYLSAEGLYSHLQQIHAQEFTTPEMQVISRQSRMEQPRIANECLLCSFVVTESETEPVNEQAKTALGKHPRESQSRIDDEDSRDLMDMTSVSEFQTDEMSSDSDTLSNPDVEFTPIPAKRYADDQSRAISRHIAAHLQVLMLLTVRFMALDKIEDVDAQSDCNSESVDMNDDSDPRMDTSPASTTLPMNSEFKLQLNNLGTLAHDPMTRPTETKLLQDEFTDFRNWLHREDIPIEDVIIPPDLDFDDDLSDIPRQWDIYADKRDFFYEKLVKSGAFQSWDKPEDVAFDVQQFREAAACGDERIVLDFLTRDPGYADAESMIVAVRGGYYVIVKNLMAMGGADPDPAPVVGMRPDIATPILASIGQGNIHILELLLEQKNLDPTREFDGATYAEIARRRQGPNWEDEVKMLEQAYDAYVRVQKEFDAFVSLPQTPFVCPSCSKVFLRPSELKYHMRRHDEPWACIYLNCGNKFRLTNDWKRHIFSHHPAGQQTKGWKCEFSECDNWFYPSRREFEEHLITKHEIESLDDIDNKVRTQVIGDHEGNRFWCGFCTNAILHFSPDSNFNVIDKSNRRLQHISDHITGSNGLLKRSFEEWKYFEHQPGMKLNVHARTPKGLDNAATGSSDDAKDLNSDADDLIRGDPSEFIDIDAISTAFTTDDYYQYNRSMSIPQLLPSLVISHGSGSESIPALESIEGRYGQSSIDQDMLRRLDPRRDTQK